VAAAIASHGVTEAAGVGEIVSEAAKFLVDPAATLIANVSVPKNEFQSRILHVNEVNLKWLLLTQHSIEHPTGGPKSGTIPDSTL
jgi:hypothetical protein